MLFYPDLPRPINKITDICNRLKISISNNPLSHFDLAIHWNYNTYCKLPDVVKDLHAKKPFINGDLFDVSKSYVDSIFEEVFSISTLIKKDHVFTNGLCVKKCELQASHDMSIIPIPSVRDPGFVYQKLFDSRFCFSHCVDLRVPVFGNTIPFVFAKIKSITNPVRSLEAVSLLDTHDTFSDDEISNILLFSRYMGMDFGELDIIRNNSDNQIYILDVNNMPGNQLFKRLSTHDANKYKQLFADHFKQNFML
jgi:hypothetical protein